MASEWSVEWGRDVYAAAPRPTREARFSLELTLDIRAAGRPIVPGAVDAILEHLSAAAWLLRLGGGTALLPCSTPLCNSNTHQHSC